MKSGVFFALLNALLVCADRIDSTLFNLTSRPNVIPNRFIIEVESTSSLKSLKRRGFHPLDVVYHQIKARDIHFHVTKEFKMEGIFNGAALIVNNAEDVALIKNTPGIKEIRPIRIFPKTKLAKRLKPGDVKIPPDTFSTHILGGVDKVHAEGNIGQGVKIGIIDTGIDYNHPVFGSNGFGPDKKIVTGYDFVGNDFDPYDPNSKPKPKPDPMDCDGHGTHVAGIIAAQPGNLYNISGVAYGATLGAYKIFGCAGDTSDDVIVEALGQGVKDDMDILTLSFGIRNSWASTTTAVVADRIAKSGKIITVAVGNDGDFGSWYASTPATGQGVISIGSVDNTVIPLQNAIVHGVDHPPITYFSVLPLNISGSLPIYAISTNTSVEDDACSPLAQDTPDLNKYLVVIRRGTCDFLIKLDNVAAKGAKATLIYDNGAGFISILTGNYTASLIQAADGEFLVKQFVAGAPITVSFPHDRVGAVTNFPDDHGGLMSTFSSYGPSFDFGFKPSFAAPGENIISTYPVALGSFAVLSGTSMAAPFAAGAAALLLAAKGKSVSTVRGARTLFQITSTMIPASKNDIGFETLTQAGAGLINVYKAIHSTTIVSPGELILNDIAHFQRKHTILIQNIGDTAKNYKLKHVPALTALTMKEKSILPSLGPVPLVSAPAAVDILPSTIMVPPGASQEVVVTFTPPSGLHASRYPVYSGFVEVKSGTESYHVSYIGLGASLKDHQIFDNTTDVVILPSPSLLNENGTVLLTPTNFTFNGTDYPKLFWRLAMGTPALLIDLVEANIQFTPTFPKRSPGGLFADVKVIGSLFYLDYEGRNDENLDITDPIKQNVYKTMNISKAQFANKTTIPNGQYRILMRALRITGDPKSEGDYESWLSPIVGIHA